jgi:hypothetical protein
MFEYIYLRNMNSSGCTHKYSLPVIRRSDSYVGEGGGDKTGYLLYSLYVVLKSVIRCYNHIRLAKPEQGTFCLRVVTFFSVADNKSVLS